LTKALPQTPLGSLQHSPDTVAGSGLLLRGVEGREWRKGPASEGRKEGRGGEGGKGMGRSHTVLQTQPLKVS